MRRADRRGVALVVVLALLAALGGLAAGVARATRVEARSVAALRARTVARYAAESGVVAAEWRIQTLLDSLDQPLERAAAFRNPEAALGPIASATLGGARFELVVVDLNARVDLNLSDSATVHGLFAQFTTDTRAAEIVAAIRAEPLRRVGELALVPGVDDSLAAAVAPYVTVWGDGSVNLNSAPEPVLAALPGLGEAGARTLLERRAGGELFASAAAISPRSVPAAPPSDEDGGGDEIFGGGDQGPPAVAAGPALRVSAAPTRILVVSRGWETGHPLTHEVQAVYAVAGARLALQVWQEQDL